MADDDTILLEKWLKERDAQAFDELVTRYADPVFATCWRILRNDSDAEDAAQDCFLKLARVESPPRRSLGGWLHTTASRGAIDHLRARKRRHNRDRKIAGRETSRPDGDTSWADIQAHVDASIADLPERLRQVLVGHFIERRNLEQIAADLGVSRQTVSNRVAKAIEAVRRSLRRKGISASAVLLLGLLAAGPTRAAPLTLLASLGRFAVAGTRTVAGPSARVLPSLLSTGGLLMAQKLIAIAALCILAVLIGSTAFVVRLGNLAPSSPPPPATADGSQSAKGAGAESPAAALALAGGDRRSKSPGALWSSHRPRPDAADAGWTISGRVVRTGEARGAEIGSSWVAETRPAAGAVVYLKPHPRKVSEGEVPPISRRIVKAGGEFTFTGVPGGVWLRLEIDDPSSAYRTLSFRFDEPTEESHVKELGDILVGPGGLLTIELHGPSDEPVAGGTVLVNRAAPEPNLTAAGLSDSRREAVKKAPGVYVLTRASMGSLKIRARAPGHAPAEPVMAEMPLDQPVIIQLGEGSVIAGRVMTLDGQPIAGAEVAAAAKSEDPSRARTDASGRFVLDDLSVEKHTLTVTAEGFVSLSTESTPGAEELQFMLASEGFLAGTVIDDDGRPIARARVLLIPTTPGTPSASAISSPRGTFTFRNLLEDSYTIVADRAGFAPAAAGAFAVKAGERVAGQVLQLGRGFSAEGMVVDAKSRKPIAGAKVIIRLGGEGLDAINRPARTDDSGAFTVSGLIEDRWIITAEADGYPAQEKPVELVLGKPMDLTIALKQASDAALEMAMIFEGRQKDLTLTYLKEINTLVQQQTEGQLTTVDSLLQGVALQELKEKNAASASLFRDVVRTKLVEADKAYINWSPDTGAGLVLVGTGTEGSHTVDAVGWYKKAFDRIAVEDALPKAEAPAAGAGEKKTFVEETLLRLTPDAGASQASEVPVEAAAGSAAAPEGE